MNPTNSLLPIHDNGVLVGWLGFQFNNEGKMVRVFVPRRDEDIESDRAEKWNARMNPLIREYEAYITEQHLPAMSADELIHEDITDDQRKWLSNFIQRWTEGEEDCR